MRRFGRVTTATVILLVFLAPGPSVWAAVSFGEIQKLTPADATSVDYFGSAVAVDDNTMVIGARSDNGQTGAVYVFSRSFGGSSGWNEVAKLTASDGDYGFYFGAAVAIYGDTIVVGASLADGAASQSGAAYVFQRNHGGVDAWGEVAKLTSADGQTYDEFGGFVAIDGDTVAVGAKYVDGAASDEGAVYLFERNGGGADNWGQAAKITGSSSAGWSYYGSSVALKGDSLFVGSPNDDLVYIYDRNQGGTDSWGETHQFTGSTGGLTNFAFGNRISVSDDVLAVASHSSIDTGAVWVFERNHGGVDAWGEVQRMTSPDGSVGNMYGVVVAVDNNRILVGASRIDTGGVDAGTAYVYERNSGGADNWGLTQTLIASDVEAEDYFGEALAIDGDTMLIGSYGDDVNGNFSGSAYVFSACGGVPGDWQNGFDIYASDFANGDRFGYTADVFGDTVIVGAWGDDDLGSDSGSAYIYERNTGGADTWGELTKINATDGASGHHFGWSVGIWNDTAVVGGNSAGAMYVFERNAGGADNWGQSARMTASDANSGHLLGGSVDISGDTVVAGAHYWGTPGHSAIGAAYVFERNSGGPDAWSETAKLMASDAADFDMFAHSVAIDGDTIVIGADNDDDNGADSGSAYVFYRHQGGPDVWGQVAKLTASDGAAGDYFGISVAIDGDVIVVGADRDDDAGGSSGSVYVFYRNQGGADAWGEVAKLTSSDATAGDEFGESVAIFGPTIAVGAPRKNPTWGTVYLFSRNLGGVDNWGELTKIENPHSNAGEYFGTATALTTDIAVIGTPNDWDGSAATGSITIHRFGCLDYDFGDAPDPSFPTLLSSDGPRHQLGGPLYLGSSIDMDFDGQPTASADGDDTDSDGDDDDGVVFTSILLPGVSADLDVTASAAGILSAWIDFNADGDWNDAGEQVFTDQALTVGVNSLQVAIPAGASTDPIIARFRLDSGGGLTPTGGAADGEVEDYALSIVNYDFGDAPDPTFPTMLASDGARHTIVTGYHLGNDVDAEPDGQPTAYADGDDYDAQGDDDDGVAFTTLLLPSHTGGVNVTASAAGFLNAWIDFNADGDWNDAGEQIFTDESLLSGTNSLTFGVPATASTGAYTITRFRFNSTGGLTPTGAADDGEVEDGRIFIWGLDYGDAPDPTYPTLLASDGARHYVDGALYLGSSVDDETNGQPTASADGDDLGGADDEDGVVFTSPIAPGLTAQVDVTASTSGLLSAWIDFNADGDWDDTGEWIFADQSVTGGVNSLGFPVPGDAVVGSTFARFRLTTTAGLYPVGTAPNGEVEDYMVTVDAFDFGDAPDPTYPTLLASNGARHVIGGSLYLGSGVDADPDGQPNVNANGDDNDPDGDDEDGVSFTSWIVAGRTCDIRFTASGAGYVNAWFDFNADGDWADAGEQIFADQPVVPGQNNLTYDIPLTAAIDVSTYVRVRLDSAGGLSFDGSAPDGEVEDYHVMIAALDFGDAPDPSYPTLMASDGARHIIADGLFLGASVDMEADGQPTAGADGDDNDGSDDEDGVVFTSVLGVGTDATLDVTASAAGILSAWVDFNSDGDWSDAGEQIITDQPLTAGINSLSFPVPSDAAVGSTYARFRLSLNTGLQPNGYATHGEVEDYQVDIVSADLEVSIGDSPDPVAEGGLLTYYVTVSNVGQVEAADVELAHTLPAEGSFAGVNHAACSETGGVVECDFGALAAGASVEVEVEFNVDFGAVGAITSTALVQTSDLDPIPANDTDSETTTVVDEPTFIFSDGFESGDLSRWSSTTR